MRAANPSPAQRVRVLFVDDEPLVLSSLRRILDSEYEVVIARGGTEALALMRSGPPFAVVIADMRMPGMTGTAFLAQVAAEFPDTTRMLLTGQYETHEVTPAGQIFRFLTKPCPRDELSAALRAAVEQHLERP